MIAKRIDGRKDGRTSAGAALRYGEGLTPDRRTGELLDKSHRTRFGGFGLVDDGVYAGRSSADMAELIDLAAIEMQANCDMNTRVRADKKLAHFVVSFKQDKPSEAVLRDAEDSMLSALKLSDHHFATFLHDDNGYWHLHIFASCIEQGPLHRGNPLWHDRIKRDQVCREIEGRHGLTPDPGLHRFDELGQIVEIPREERIAQREAKQAAQPAISDRAKTKEIYSGEKSFQTWCNEIRIGDRLKHAKSWQALHQAAAAYGCAVQPKGAGFVLCPAGEKGGIQLSRLGLKKLPEKFGAFVAPSIQSAAPQAPEARYAPAPTHGQGGGHYASWRAAKAAFEPVKSAAIDAQREDHKAVRGDLREQHKSELKQIRAMAHGPERVAAVSVAKMEHVLAATALTAQFAADRQALRKKLNAEGPGNTYRDFLVVEAGKGDGAALRLARKYGVEEATDVLRQREAAELKIVAAVAGSEYRPGLRLSATHHVQRNGTVVYDLGGARTLTDSAISKQVQLNGAAADSPEAVAVALRFAVAKFGSTLTLTGSPEFQRLAVETAVRNRLPIRFADPALDGYRASLVAAQNHKQLQKGVTNVLARNIHFTTPYDNILHLDANRARLAAERSGRVHELPDRGVDARRGGSEVLLPDALQVHVGDARSGQDPDLRRAGAGTGSSGRIRTDVAADPAGQRDPHGDNQPDNGPAAEHVGRRIRTSRTAGHGSNRNGSTGILHREGRSVAHPDSDAARGRTRTAAADVIRKQKSAPVTPAPAAAAPPLQPLRAAESTAPALLTAEQWLANNHPSWTKESPRQSSGVALYVAPDGYWIQKLGRGGAVAIRPPADFLIQVGDLIDYKDGKSTRVARGVDKGRGS